MEKNLSSFIGVVMSLLCFLFGKIDTPLIVLIFVILADYITGMIKAIEKKKVSSKTGLKGFFKKLAILIIIAFGVKLDVLVGSNGLIRNFVLYYYIANEGLSIIENCIALGVPIPDVIVNTLEQIKKESEDKKE